MCSIIWLIVTLDAFSHATSPFGLGILPGVVFRDLQPYCAADYFKTSLLRVDVLSVYSMSRITTPLIMGLAFYAVGIFPIGSFDADCSGHDPSRIDDSIQTLRNL